MNQQPIYEEKTSYRVLLTRKNRMMKIIENGFILLGLFLLLVFFEWRSMTFIIGFVILIIFILFVIPFLYLLMFHPRYILYNDRLVVQIGNRTDSIPISEIKHSQDLPYYFQIRGKRTPLLVSDECLEHLNLQLEVIKRGWNS
ncbi:hypothetical protein [Thermoflavimicrobium daqui]|uniref:Uncharacterized protein n=1 Tax=Thermoflavimicrobium daqui TaxID=2137476 RepID=A0A364K1Z1_9BACL|nr:hypothetical protein [Thermoflavimicrobium daqui]RAL22046.1 hypothetical protein DL897_14725 [Thermoflavimicrobium daqui]